MNNIFNKNSRIALSAFAKINLSLEVLGKRDDGYHELRSVMHSVGVSDRVELVFSEPYGEKISVAASEPLPYNNTARRAAEAYLAEAGVVPDEKISIFIEKGIPSEAGLGGGSADAAVVLFALEERYHALGRERLFAVSAGVGADVPFCLHGGCALCEGIGEKLTALPSLSMPLLIVKGERGVSTGALFRSLSPDSFTKEDRTAPLLKAITAEADPAAAVSRRLVNDLAPAAEALAPEIGVYRERMLSLGALGAEMSGSGSAVYGIFPTLDEARRAEAFFTDCAFHAACMSVGAPFSGELV